MSAMLEYPAQPEGELKYLFTNYGYEYPIEVRQWIWSTTFGTWGRVVKFANGLVLYTFPQPQPITTIDPEEGNSMEHTRTIGTAQSLQESEDRAKLRREEYRVRGLAMGYYRHEFNGHTLHLLTSIAPEESRRNELRLPLGATLPALWIDGQTSIDLLAKCAGLKSYDCALPMVWVRKEFLDVGKPFPRGVWSYDDNKNFGEFVPMMVMLDRIAQMLLCDGLGALGLTFEATQPRPSIEEGSGTRSNP